MNYIEIDKIKPAVYNPRELSDDAFKTLRKSINELGVIKPIIVNEKNMVIVAGHQRTKAMKSLGIEKCPAFLLSGLNTADEIRFNQLHNRCEYEISEDAPKVRIRRKLNLGFNAVSAKDVEILSLGKNNGLNNELCRMISKYGEFCSPIADEQGNIVISSAYARASATIGKSFYVFVLENAKVPIAVEYFSKTYGKFSYKHIKRETYHQRYVQLKRLRSATSSKYAIDKFKRTGNANIKQNKSTLYENFVIPYLQQHKNVRALDFGCGQKDYVNKLKTEYNIIGVDPYRPIIGSYKIDINGNKTDFIKVIESIKKFGLFDLVICDSVLNSVDSLQAENDVVNTCRALCKDGGQIFMCGRQLTDADRNRNARKPGDIYYLDENYFTANFRDGAWFYQHFHDREYIERIAKQIGINWEIRYVKNRGSFFAIDAKKDPMPVDVALEALSHEFNMMLPNGKSYGLQDEIKEAYLYAISSNKNI